MRNSFVFYSSWWEAIKNLPREIQGEVLTAIIEYGLTGETTESLKPITKALLAIVMPQIDSNNKKYENGSKGGRPQTKAKPNQNQIETKPKPNGNQSGTYNVICNMNNADDKWEDKSSTPQSPPGGEEGGTDYLASSLSQRDGIPRNFDGLCREMQALGIPQRQQDEIMRLSNFGQIGHPVWQHLKHCRESRDARLEKNRVKLPGSYILKQLRSDAAPNPKPAEGPTDGG